MRTTSPSKGGSRLGVVGEAIASLPDHELAHLEVALGRCVGDVADAPRARRLVATIATEAQQEGKIRERLGGPRWL